MPDRPAIKPLLAAAALVAEHGDDAAEEVWRLGQQLAMSGRADELPNLVAVMKAIRLISRTREAGVVVH